MRVFTFHQHAGNLLILVLVIMSLALLLVVVVHPIRTSTISN